MLSTDISVMSPETPSTNCSLAPETSVHTIGRLNIFASVTVVTYPSCLDV